MEKNTVNDNKGKDGILKVLAIGGFIGLIIIIAWLGIQLISFMPNAFNSLASLANSVYNYKPVEIVVVSNKAVANAGESFTLTWNKPKQDGTFTFTYTCTEGVSVEVRATQDSIETVTCDEAYDIGAVETIDLSVNSERNRFTEIPYTIAFIPSKSDEPAATTEKTITVVNAMISPVAVVATTTPDVIITPDPKPVVVAKPEPKPVTLTPTPKPTPVTPKPSTPPKPVVVSTPIYGIPVSNPKGFTDVGVRILAFGTINNTGRFIAANSIDNDAQGAIQFEIKNFGTKTSNSFTYTATLPNGTEYKSPIQTALKPNERIVATIGFETNDMTGVESFEVEVTVNGDTNRNNNQFKSNVSIVN